MIRRLGTPDDGRIAIEIRGMCERRMIVDPCEQIYCLDFIDSFRDFMVLFDGCILNPAMSFEFYGIKDGSKIFVQSAIPPEQPGNKVSVATQTNFCLIPTKALLMSKKFRMAKNKEEILEKYQNSLNPTTAREVARLTDASRARFENNISGFRRLVQAYQSSNSINIRGEKEANVKQTNICQTSKEVCVQPLPSNESKDSVTNQTSN